LYIFSDFIIIFDFFSSHWGIQGRIRQKAIEPTPLLPQAGEATEFPGQAAEVSGQAAEVSGQAAEVSGQANVIARLRDIRK
jgi:hypothetical protein